MIVKNYKNLFSYAAALAIGIFMVSCAQEDNTGYSTMVPTDPSVTIEPLSEVTTLIENNESFEFKVTLSEAQLVDIKVYATQIAGDATAGSDYEITSPIVISAGSLSGTGEVKILRDDVPEDTETLTIQIGNEKTANPELTVYGEMKFNILNYEDGDLDIAFSWAMTDATTDNSGVVIDPTDFADMRLLISTTPDNQNIVLGADGGSFEELVIPSTLADGEYYVVTDYYAANEDLMRSLDLELNLNQIGVIVDESSSYPQAITNADGTCSLNYYVMMKITKSGETYTTENISTLSFDLTVTEYTGVDADYDSQITTNEDCFGTTMAGFNAEWMLDFWGETIIEEGTVYYTVDAGVITIESQYVFTTEYNGAPYVYTISGTGTLDDATGDITLQYYLDQEGFSPSNWAFDNGYQDTPYFEAIISPTM